MPTHETSEESAPNPFKCDCKKDMRQACAGEGFYKEKEGKRYCVLHYPGDEKAADFQKALHKKQSAKDYNFKGVWFPKGVKFKELHLDGNADFSFASFSGYTSFSHAVFKDYLYFAAKPEERTLGDQTHLEFQFAHVEKPDRVSFHTLELKPHWFVNVDSRKFEFTAVEFNYDLNDELERLNKADVSAPHRLLSIACRQLADNAETNHRYHEASRLRYSSFDARRVERFYGFGFWRLDWWYWMASGYGEKVLRAFIVFVVLIGLCTIGYKYSSFECWPSPSESTLRRLACGT